MTKRQRPDIRPGCTGTYQPDGDSYDGMVFSAVVTRCEVGGVTVERFAYDHDNRPGKPEALVDLRLPDSTVIEKAPYRGNRAGRPSWCMPIIDSIKAR